MERKQMRQRKRMHAPAAGAKQGAAQKMMRVRKGQASKPKSSARQKQEEVAEKFMKTPDFKKKSKRKEDMTYKGKKK